MAWVTAEPLEKAGMSVSPELDTLEQGHLLSGLEVVQSLSLGAAKGIRARAVSGLGRGRKVHVNILPCLMCTCVRAHTPPHTDVVCSEPGDSQGSRANSRLCHHPQPQRMDSQALLALAQDAGQALAGSSGPLTYLYSHFTELETEAQADGHRASEQDSEIQVTETGAGQGGLQMESEANGGKGPSEVT